MFCDTLKMLRKQRKIKQSEMAAALNVTQGAIANWENGIRAPSIDALPDIARLLDVSIDQLFGIQPTPQIILTDEEKRVLSAYRAADDKIKRGALSMLEMFPSEKTEYIEHLMND